MKKIHPIDGDYIELEGMGGNINYPAALIHAALELAGYEVEMHNDCGGGDPNDYWFVDKEKYKDCLTGKTPWPTRVKGNKPKVQVKVKHVPWGG